MLFWNVMTLVVLMGLDHWVANAVQKNNVVLRRLLRLPLVLSLTSTRPNMCGFLSLVGYD